MMSHAAHYDERFAHMERHGGGVAFHVGMHDPEGVLPESIAWVSDGDSWEEWGERREEGQPQHVVVLTFHPEEMLEALRQLDSVGHLVPMRATPGIDQEGYVICCTDPFEWSRQEFSQFEVRR